MNQSLAQFVHTSIKSIHSGDTMGTKGRRFGLTDKSLLNHVITFLSELFTAVNKTIFR